MNRHILIRLFVWSFLMVGVYKETGVWTVVSFGLIFIAFELIDFGLKVLGRKTK